MNHEQQTLSEELEEKQNRFYMDIAKRLLGHFDNHNPSINQLCDFQWLLCQTGVARFVALDPCLTEEEATTLYLSAQGKTSKQIARVFVVCPRQVERYRASILKKLRCKNMTHAVMKGIKMLDIKPPLKREKEQGNDNEVS
jgi:DNA-binding NarL/FixJ family response regulator